MDAVIVGGGIMGCAAALALAERGAKCTVLERSVPGAEASTAAAGILGAQLEAHAHRSALATLVRARAGYAEWARWLRDETGIDAAHRVCGAIRVARAEAEADDLGREVEWQRGEGLRAELVDGRGARAIEPELGEIVCAAHYPDEAQIDPPQLLRALVAALARAGVLTRSGATVQRLAVEGGRCRGVVVDDGAEVRGDAVVLAAGSWASLVPGLPESLPRVVPVRGQIVQLDERPPRVRRIVVGARGYVVPRGDGRVLCGSTMENVGFKKDVTAGGVRSILDHALALVPSLEGASVTATWSNFRPRVEGEPLVGASPLPGLFLATGHFRNGILLARETALAVSAAVLGAPAP